MQRRFARSAAVLEQVGQVLLQQVATTDALMHWQRQDLQHWLVGQDVFAQAPDASQAIYKAMSEDFEGVQRVLGAPAEVNVAQVRLAAVCAAGSTRTQSTLKLFQACSPRGAVAALWHTFIGPCSTASGQCIQRVRSAFA